MAESAFQIDMMIFFIIGCFIFLIGLLSFSCYLYRIGWCLLQDWKDYKNKKNDGEGLGIQTLFFAGYAAMFLFFLSLVLLKLWSMLSLWLMVMLFILAAVIAHYLYVRFYKKKVGL